MYDPDIHKLLLEKSAPVFAHEKLLLFDELKYLNYESQRIDRGTVDLAKVIGTAHSDYAGYSWIELLPRDYRGGYSEEDFREAERTGLQGRLHRGWERLKELHANPGYYLNAKTKHHMSFYKLNDYYYVNDGNHRTVLARLFLGLNSLPQKLKGVTIIKILDRELPQRRRSWSPGIK